MIATILIVLMILSGTVLIGSITLMSPKGGIGMGIGGASGSNEYGSKKSLEGKLKKTAIICAVIFVICSIILPYAKIG